MKIIDWDALKMTPQAKMWGGGTLALLCLVLGILVLADSRTTSDRIWACLWFANFLFYAREAWRGYQQRPKADSAK